MYDAEDFDQIQTAEFREAFNEFDKVCRVVRILFHNIFWKDNPHGYAWNKSLYRNRTQLPYLINLIKGWKWSDLL